MWGGFFDHVPPPVGADPDAGPGAVVDALIRLGRALGPATLIGGVEVPVAVRSGTLATHE